MVKMIKKVIYAISIISLVLLTVLTIEMIPLIYQAKWQGIVYFISVLSVLIFELIALLTKKNLAKNYVCYNLFLILTAMYVGIIYYRIYSINFSSSLTYGVDINYCKNNYLLISVMLFLVVVNLLSSITDSNEGKLL